MALAHIKIYVGEKHLRTFGGTKFEVHTKRKEYENMGYSEFIKYHPNITEEEFKELRVEGYRRAKRTLTEQEKEFIKKELTKEFGPQEVLTLFDVYKILETKTNLSISKVLRKIKQDPNFRRGLGVVKAISKDRIRELRMTEQEILDILLTLLGSDLGADRMKESLAVFKLWRKLSKENQYLLTRIFTKEELKNMNVYVE